VRHSFALAGECLIGFSECRHRYRSVKAQKLVEPDSVASVLLAGCCECDCLSTWSRDDVASQRRLYAAAYNEHKRTTFLMDTVRPLLPKEGRPQLRLLNRPLCVVGFCRVLGASLYKYYSVLRTLRAGSPQRQPMSAPAHGNTDRRDAPVAAAVAAWLRDFVASCPELNDGRVLAAGLTSKQQVLGEYRSDCLRSSQRAASRSVFFAVWAERFPQLRVSRQSDHASCITCVDLRADLALAETPEQAAAVVAAQRLHVGHVRGER
jgi:hypothetical protein